MKKTEPLTLMKCIMSTYFTQLYKLAEKCSQCGSIVKPFFVMQHQDRRRHNCPTDECLRCSPGDAYKVAETKPDNCWLEISGSGRQVAPAGLHVIKGGEAGESVPGQSGCDRGAASPLWPDTSDRWLTAGGPCLAVRSPLDL